MPSDPTQVLALDAVLPDSGLVERGDTVHPHAFALNVNGDSIAADIYWSALDTAIVQVLDSATGATLARAVGVGRIEARVGTLRSNPLPITVLARLDTIVADSTPARDSISLAAKPNALSDSLRVRLLTYNDTGPATPVSGRRVVFTLLAFTDSTPYALVPGDTVTTDLNGLAVVQVHVDTTATLPDSVQVQASATRVNGQPVPGSPVTFTVVFAP